MRLALLRQPALLKKDKQNLNKVVTRLFGGLGNQLFIYAASRALALRNSAELVIDDISGFVRDREYGRAYELGHFPIHARSATSCERMEPFSRLRRGIHRRLSLWRDFTNRNYIFQEGSAFDSRLISLRFSGTLHLEGYWQSVQYFIDCESQIRKDLEFDPPKDSLCLKLGERICSCKSVALHVRFFDSSLNGTDNSNVSSAYYTKALETMDKSRENVHYFVFSDRPDLVPDMLPLDRERYTLIIHSQGGQVAYSDLWLMSLCSDFIIANSTFSWWGAWLSKNAGKLVIAPDVKKLHGITCWGFAGLLPSDWEIV